MNSQAPNLPTRREWLRASLLAATFGLGQNPLTSFGFPPLEEGETLVPFLDPQPVNPDRAMIQWDQLESWITPEKDFFTVQHYGVPEVDASNWQLEISGLVRKPGSHPLERIKARPRREFIASLECGGNGAGPGFMGAIGNTRWAGTLLAPLLQEAGLEQGASEVVFYGADRGMEKIRGKEYTQNFARSLPIEDVSKLGATLVYEMGGKPLTKEHGGPLRLGVPGCFGVAWVKWLERIEVLDHRFAGKFMARDYVTIRGEQRGEETIWRETTVREMRLKSIVARVVRRADKSLRITGAAWNDGATPLERVEIRINDRPWQPAKWGEGLDHPHAWTFWSYDWKAPPAGEHTLVSRVIDKKGNRQPAADDPEIKLKRTYWEANQQVPRRIKI